MRGMYCPKVLVLYNMMEGPQVDTNNTYTYLRIR